MPASVPPHRRFGPPNACAYGGVGRTFLKLLFWCAVLAGVFLTRDRWQPAAKRALWRLRVAMPASEASPAAVRLAQGYASLRRDNIADLYAAADAFAAAAQAAEHDVAVRAAQADAETALAYAYGTSADGLARAAQSLHGAARRKVFSMHQDERHEARRHVHRAQQFAKEALRLSPVAFVAQRAMAQALSQGGRTERARPYLAQAKTACPNDIFVRIALADQQGPKNGGEAIAILLGVVAQDGGMNAARMRLAGLFRRQEERRDARQQLLGILAQTPGHELARRSLLELEPMATRSRAEAAWAVLPREAEVRAAQAAQAVSAAAGAKPTPAADGNALFSTLGLSPEYSAGLRAWLAAGEARALAAMVWLQAEAAWGLHRGQEALLRRLAQLETQPLSPGAAGSPPAGATGQTAAPGPAPNAIEPPNSVEPQPGNPAELAGPQPVSGLGAAPAAAGIAPPATDLAPPGASVQPSIAGVAAGVTARVSGQELSFDDAMAAGAAAQKARDLPRARQSFALALRLRPTSSAAATALGWCALQNKEGSAAAASFRKALEYAPRDPEAQFGLAESWRLVGDVSAAQDAYRRYLVLAPDGPLAPLCHRELENLGHER